MTFIVVKDEIDTFIPRSNKVNYIILGTMASCCARTIGEVIPQEAFYYHNSKNHCWKMLSNIFYGEVRDMKKLIDRQNLLEEFGIAMANIVKSAEVPESESLNPADSVLFDAHALKKLETKKISDEFKHLLQTRPIFFTCKSKPALTSLLEEYFSANKLDQNLIQKIHYLPSPTRCSPVDRSSDWIKLGLNFNNVLS